MPKRRGRGEGGLERLPSGSIRASVPVGRDAGGKPVIDRATFPDKAAAVAWITRRLAEVQAGKAAPGRVTLAKWIEQYLHIYAGKRRPASVRLTRYALTSETIMPARLAVSIIAREYLRYQHKLVKCNDVA